MFDLVIHSGTIIDGTNSPRRAADLGIRGGRVEAVGDLKRADAHKRIDAKGRIVAPGFIDVHTHADGWLLKTPHLVSKTTQGFTTEVLMADGISYAPVDERTAPEWLFYLRALDGLRMDEYRGWRSLADFMASLDRRTAQNAATHVPYANVRALACGFGRRTVDDFQMRQIKAEIHKAMDEAAVGLSTGLDYIAQCFATTDELVEACSAVAESGGLYVTHMRYKMGLLPAMKEAVEIARRSGVRLHISHLKAPTPALAEQVLEYIDTVARNEVDLSFDVYPYQRGSTMLSALLPYEVWEDGPLAVLGKLRDPAVQARFADGLELHKAGLDRIRIAWVAGKENSIYQGKRLSDYVRETRLPPEEALTNLLIEERLAVLMVVNEGDDRLVEPMLKHDLHMVGSDGIFAEGGVVHPRQYGSAGRILGPCVRERRLFSLEEAVHKLSGRPAERFGLKHRGVLREGCFADVVVFDPETVADRATYDDPHQTCAGIGHVLVNGTLIVENGAPVAQLPPVLPGRFLRRDREE